MRSESHTRDVSASRTERGRRARHTPAPPTRRDTAHGAAWRAPTGEPPRCPGERLRQAEPALTPVDGVRHLRPLEINGARAYLNADTTRQAVLDLLVYATASSRPPELDVVANVKGKINKVVYRTEVKLPGWYCYVSPPRTHVGAL